MSAAVSPVELVPNESRFGQLTYVGPAPKSRRGHAMILCRCDCGTERAFARAKVVHGYTRSCGHTIKQGHDRWSRATFGARSLPR